MAQKLSPYVLFWRFKVEALKRLGANEIENQRLETKA